jgi:DNA-binding CsgD family transcriptional regulator
MNLPVFLQILERCPDVSAIRADFVPRVSKHFEATRGALFIFDEIAEGVFDWNKNPITKYLMEHHAPIHERQILDEGRWEAICSRSDHGHVIVGPVVKNHQIIGALAFTRKVGEPPFTTEHISGLTALCLHLSLWFASQQQSTKPDLIALTPREKQVTQLASQGLTNVQIAEKLCVSSDAIKQTLRRIFQKTGLKSRVELTRWWTISS